MSVAPLDDQAERAELAARISRAAARQDVVDAFKNIQTSISLAWWDIKIRYQRTMLGPIWITVSTAVFVVSLGILYSQIFDTAIDDYLPFLAAGFMVWNLMAMSVIEAPTVFSGASSYINSMRIPLLTHVIRHLAGHTIVFLHTLIVIISVVVYVGMPPNFNMLLTLPGLVLLLANTFWISWLLALLGARYRDIGPIVNSVFQLMFFLTPIIWRRDVLKIDGPSIWIEGNPFYHLINVVRAPMLGQVPDPLNYYVAIGIFVVGSVVAYLMFLKYRRRVAYWI